MILRSNYGRYMINASAPGKSNKVIGKSKVLMPDNWLLMRSLEVEHFCAIDRMVLSFSTCNHDLKTWLICILYTSLSVKATDWLFRIWNNPVKVKVWNIFLRAIIMRLMILWEVIYSFVAGGSDLSWAVSLC